MRCCADGAPRDGGCRQRQQTPRRARLEDAGTLPMRRIARGCEGDPIAHFAAIPESDPPCTGPAVEALEPDSPVMSAAASAVRDVRFYTWVSTQQDLIVLRLGQGSGPGGSLDSMLTNDSPTRRGPPRSVSVGSASAMPVVRLGSDLRPQGTSGRFPECADNGQPDMTLDSGSGWYCAPCWMRGS